MQLTAAELAALNAGQPVSILSPVIVTTPPPAAGSDAVVMSAGKFYWSGNYNYDNIVEVDGVTFAGQVCSMFIAKTPGGGGGWLPRRDAVALPQPGHFDTTGYEFLSLTLASTRPGQQWQGVVPDVPNTPTATDHPVPGANSVNITDFGPAPVVGQFATYKIPLHAGGYNMPPGVIIWKFGVQDQMGFVNPSEAAGNVWYVADARFTAS
jgi:hypothetical protein